MDKWQLAERGLKLNAELQRVYQDFQETRFALLSKLFSEGVENEDAWCKKRMDTPFGNVTPEFSNPCFEIEDVQELVEWCSRNRYHAGATADPLLDCRMEWVVSRPTSLLAELEYTPEGVVEYHGIPVDGVRFKDAEPNGISFHPCQSLKDSTREGRQI